MNSVYISKEAYEAKEHLALLKYLMDASYGASEYCFDIHITPEDCGAFRIEWIQRPWDNSFGEKFVCLNEEGYTDMLFEKEVDNKEKL